MSVFSLQLQNNIQPISASNENKLKYGEVITPLGFAEQILDLLPKNIFQNPDLKWLDPCVGTGNFCVVLYKKLFQNLSAKIKEPKKRHQHIIENMIYMVELNEEHLPGLYELFGEKSNIAFMDYLELTNQKFDIIIGNPPFNVDGAKKVPTNKKSSKKNDGKAIWMNFVENSIYNLNDNGYLAMITPSLWMKRDHALFPKMRTWGEIIKLHSLTNTETNRIFLKQAQTPTCYFALHKNSKNKIKTYDNCKKDYLLCDINLSIPLQNPGIISKMLRCVSKVGSIPVIKTSMRPDYKGFTVTSRFDKEHTFKNISTCILNGLQPELVINYTNKPCHYNGKKKLVLAHKMYGFPFYDKKGEYGISNRDNYVILGYSDEEFEQLKQFLSTNLALLIFETTRYRMKYLEKYAFEYIPDITKLNDFPEIITNKTINDYFKLDEMERHEVAHITNKKYKLIN